MQAGLTEHAGTVEAMSEVALALADSPYFFLDLIGFLNCLNRASINF